METPYEPQTKPHFYVRILAGIGVASAVIFVSVYVYMEHLNVPPASFPVDADIVIEEGGTISSVAVGLSEAGVVQSAFYLYLILNTEYKNAYVQAGTYRFPSALTAQSVARAITNGEHQSPLLRVTFPEGFKTKDFYTYATGIERTLDEAELVSYEGYLFPDTYFISRGSTADEIRIIMGNTFEKKLTPFSERIVASGMSTAEVITLASIIEREAKEQESKHIVAGILLNRLEKDMPLQVDATLEYILDKESSELTLDDLKTDSPYNTYTHRGLPPTPIANPGLEAIEAVLSPTESDYLYYLTAPDGTFYYAETFEEHKQNKARYLR